MTHWRSRFTHKKSSGHTTFNPCWASMWRSLEKRVLSHAREHVTSHAKPCWVTPRPDRRTNQILADIRRKCKPGIEGSHSDLGPFPRNLGYNVYLLIFDSQNFNMYQNFFRKVKNCGGGFCSIQALSLCDFCCGLDLHSHNIFLACNLARRNCRAMIWGQLMDHEIPVNYD